MTKKKLVALWGRVPDHLAQLLKLRLVRERKSFAAWLNKQIEQYLDDA